MDKQVEKLLKGIMKSDGKKANPREYSPLALAYIGDAVFDMVVRTKIVQLGNAPVYKLHERAKRYVKASAQAQFYHEIQELLTDEEQSVFRRGRNAKSATMPKNASVSDYRHATGVETLIGYLYLDGKIERILEIMEHGIKKQEEKA